MICADNRELLDYVPSTLKGAINNFLKRVDSNADTPDGYYEIDGSDCFAKVMTYPLKNREDCLIESHKTYVDVQSTISGVEGISVFDPKDVHYDIAYETESDVQFSQERLTDPVVSVCNTPGRFSMIFPGEPHRPMEINPMYDGMVKKFVIKIRYGAFNE